MLSRLIPKPSHFRLLTLISPKPHSPPIPNFTSLLRPFSSNHNNNGNNNGRDKPFPDSWNLSRESDSKLDPFFADGTGSDSRDRDDDSWLKAEDDGENGKEFGASSGGGGGGGDDDWMTAAGEERWSFAEEENDDVFDLGDSESLVGGVEDESSVGSRRIASEELEREEKELTAIVKGPDRAFGDLIAASGITDAMLDSLIALKDFEDIDGLPPLREIEDIWVERNSRKSPRFSIELQKQEELAKLRVRRVDEKGRAYGTGRRKCSTARVWVQPGDGKFVVNGKEFDAYFPMLDHRAALLRPFSETKTLGLWDVNCNVKGGGTSGQVGAIQLGISRALQNWEPGLRPVLRDGGYLTRDSRMVERKKPGKAKARKSFQWVKR
uniref:Ribosomal protein S5 domain 2-like superfamily protein n=1 Tax=Hypseocharis bilobata TaxID=253189 RepID=A0A0G4ANT9_9ROSI|nr:ribosomal protein S5 domain 2-like superfamily protein [Hypseocharis bilobata]